MDLKIGQFWPNVSKIGLVSSKTTCFMTSFFLLKFSYLLICFITILSKGRWTNLHLMKMHIHENGNCCFKNDFNPICVLALAGPAQRNANSFFALGKTIKMVRAHYFQNIILFEVRVRKRLNFLCQKEIAPVEILF